MFHGDLISLEKWLLVEVTHILYGNIVRYYMRWHVLGRNNTFPINNKQEIASKEWGSSPTQLESLLAQNGAERSNSNKDFTRKSEHWYLLVRQ